MAKIKQLSHYRPSKSKSTKRKSKRKPQGIISNFKSHQRLSIVFGLLLLGMLGLGTRLYHLQVVEAPELLQKARQQQMTSLSLYLPRRQILDRDNNVLATDKLVYTLYIHPKFFTEEPKVIAEKLANTLKEYTAEELLAKFQLRETGILITKNIPEHIATKIKNLGINGVDLNEYYARFYPQDTTLAEVIGYVDREHKGQAGIEYSQESIIQPNLAPANLSINTNGQGTLIPTNIPDGLMRVDDLKIKLTVDLRLQKMGTTALQKQMQKYRAKRGTVIVMDVNDGSILALVCNPTYNPNKYYDYPVELFKNWAVTDLYEPGSTFKPINVAIALEMGVITPDTRIYDEGKIKIESWEIRNHDYETEGGHGWLNIAEILQKSSNVGMIEIMKRIPAQDYYQYLVNLGLRDKVGVDLPSDIKSHLKPKVEFLVREIEPATASFGQGFALTPLKLVQLNAVLANGGKLVTPHVIQGLVDDNHKLHWQPTYQSRKIFSSQTTEQVLAMMTTVVTEGSGQAADIPDYQVAGKTGTAQKAVRGGYDSQAKITSFVAIVPANAPRYVVLAVVDEPQGYDTYGSTVAAPIVGEVIESLIALEGIPPSSETKSESE